MMDKKFIYYLTPVLLAMLIFASDFLSTNLFSMGVQNFAVWFVLSIFCFACGWLIDKTLGWTVGGRTVFAVVVAVVFITIVMVSLFSDYFGIENLVTENLILYSLRNIMLGAMAFFGMAVADLLKLQKQISIFDKKNNMIQANEADAKKRAKLMMDEAKLEAGKIKFEAEKELALIVQRKEHAENQLRELIEVEKELIKRYDDEEK
jgi:hypothetical protein